MTLFGLFLIALVLAAVVAVARGYSNRQHPYYVFRQKGVPPVYPVDRPYPDRTSSKNIGRVLGAWLGMFLAFWLIAQAFHFFRHHSADNVLFFDGASGLFWPALFGSLALAILLGTTSVNRVYTVRRWAYKRGDEQPVENGIYNDSMSTRFTRSMAHFAITLVALLVFLFCLLVLWDRAWVHDSSGSAPADTEEQIEEPPR